MIRKIIGTLLIIVGMIAMISSNVPYYAVGSTMLGMILIGWAMDSDDKKCRLPIQL